MREEMPTLRSWLVALLILITALPGQASTGGIPEP